MSNSLTYTIEPLNEPRGEGWGWEPCDEQDATCFAVICVESGEVRDGSAPDDPRASWKLLSTRVQQNENQSLALLLVRPARYLRHTG
jgi:hypothetical protein